MENKDKHANTWHSETVDPDKIVCRTCAYKNGGGLKYPHYTKGNCEMYPYPESKPFEVLFRGAKCLYYKPEDGAEPAATT